MLVVVAVHLLVAALGADAALYQWSCSPLNTTKNHYTLPHFDYGDDQNVARIRKDLLYNTSSMVDIYPVPSTLNCSGTVSAVEFCYFGQASAISSGSKTQVFKLLVLEQNNLMFTITDAINVSSTALHCSQRFFASFLRPSKYCCDSMKLDSTQQFHLPKSNFAFGVEAASSNVSQLRYDIMAYSQYQVEQYSLPLSQFGIRKVGDTFTVTNNHRRADMALRLLQLVITPTSGNRLTTNVSPGNADTPRQLSASARAGIAVGAIGAVLLFILISILATLTAIHHRKGKQDSTEMSANEAYGLHAGHGNVKYSMMQRDDIIYDTPLRL